MGEGCWFPPPNPWRKRAGPALCCSQWACALRRKRRGPEAAAWRPSAAPPPLPAPARGGLRRVSSLPPHTHSRGAAAGRPRFIKWRFEVSCRGSVTGSWPPESASSPTSRATPAAMPPTVFSSWGACACPTGPAPTC